MTLSLKCDAIIIHASCYKKAEWSVSLAKIHFLKCICVQDVKSGFTNFYQLKPI